MPSQPPPPAPCHPELLLDLLVNDELPESQRADFLRSLTPNQWRSLSLRFLERQVERKSVGQLISAATLYPEDAPPPTLLFRPRRWRYPAAIAAGLLIALASVTLTAYLMHTPSSTPSPTSLANLTSVALPANALGGGGAGGDQQSDLHVEVPVLAHPGPVSADMFLPADPEPGTKRSLVIFRQDNDRALAVPVNTFNLMWH